MSTRLEVGRSEDVEEIGDIACLAPTGAVVSLLSWPQIVETSVRFGLGPQPRELPVGATIDDVQRLVWLDSERPSIS